VIIGLIRVANTLLVASFGPGTAFIKEGGLRERMTKARLEERKKSAITNQGLMAALNQPCL